VPKGSDSRGIPHPLQNHRHRMELGRQGSNINQLPLISNHHPSVHFLVLSVSEEKDQPEPIQNRPRLSRGVKVF